MLTIEPCEHCGRETAAGSPSFSGRVRLIGKTTTYVCAACLESHDIRDESGVVLSQERLAAMSYTVHHGRTGGF